MSSSQPILLVISAHAADFVWRASGTMALYGQRGSRVRLIVLSLGERGESAELWKEPGQTIERVKARRKEEATAAAEVLGAEVRFLDLGDYPMRVGDEAMDILVEEFRSVQPDIVLAHSEKDPYNMDHATAARVTLEARVLAQARGLRPELPIIGAPPVFAFEPHQPEMCEFKPQVYVDITESFEKKRAAMACMATQKALAEYYHQLALRRGVQAVRNSARTSITYAEAFQVYYPFVGAGFP